jgi:hypothetical protein
MATLNRHDTPADRIPVAMPTFEDQSVFDEHWGFGGNPEFVLATWAFG